MAFVFTIQDSYIDPLGTHLIPARQLARKPNPLHRGPRGPYSQWCRAVVLSSVFGGHFRVLFSIKCSVQSRYFPPKLTYKLIEGPMQRIVDKEVPLHCHVNLEECMAPSRALNSGAALS